MKSTAQNTLIQTEVVFGDAHFYLYRFGQVKGELEKASHVPILHDHPFFEVMLSFKRGYEVMLEEDTLALSPHTVIIMSEGKPHCIQHAEGIFPLSFGIAMKKRERGFPLYASVRARLENQADRGQLPISLATETLFLEWYASAGRSPEAFCEGQLLASRLLYAFLKDISAFGAEELAPFGEKKASVDALLNTLLDDRRYSLKEIAVALGYTRKHTLRLIQRKYGCDYRTIKKRKAIEAAELYLFSAVKMTVKEIAAALGYESESAFYAFFKRETGMSPVKYRKEKQALSKRCFENEK